MKRLLSILLLACLYSGSGTSVNVSLVNIEARYYKGAYYSKTVGSPVRVDGKSPVFLKK